MSILNESRCTSIRDKDIIGDDSQGHKRIYQVDGTCKSVKPHAEEGRQRVGWRTGQA